MIIDKEKAIYSRATLPNMNMVKIANEIKFKANFTLERKFKTVLFHFLFVFFGFLMI